MARLKNISRAREEVLALSIWKDHRSQLVLQRQFKAGTSDMRAKRTGAWRESDWLARCYIGSASATVAVQPARTAPGAHLPHHPVDLGPGDLGHLFPPILLQAQQERSSQ